MTIISIGISIGSVDALIRTISDPCVDYRQVVSEILAADEGTRKICSMHIQSLLSSADASLRLRGVELASQIELQVDAVPALSAALADPDHRIRFGAAWGLVRLGSKAFRALDALILRFEDDIPVRDRAAWAVSNLGDQAVQALLAAFPTGAAATRALSIYCLSNIVAIERRWPHSIPDEQARSLAPFFLSALDDPEPWVQLNALHGLKTLNRRFVIPTLVKMLAQSERHFREQAALELNWASPHVTEEAVTALERCRDDENHFVRTFAREALGRKGRLKDGSSPDTVPE